MSLEELNELVLCRYVVLIPFLCRDSLAFKKPNALRFSVVFELIHQWLVTNILKAPVTKIFEVPKRNKILQDVVAMAALQRK